jgi:uncharacterized coiled-coil protein SlyX
MTSLEQRFATLEAMVTSQRTALEQQQSEIDRLNARLVPNDGRPDHADPIGVPEDRIELAGSNGMSRRR